MARDRANINTAIHADQDWRDLTIAEQHLYWLLSTHPDLNYVGVCDWRTARISAMAADATREGIQATAESLQSKRFVFIDEDTEEILVRSFLRHDGLLKQPKLSISMVNAFGAVASKKIREVVTFELQRLHVEFPEWAAFRQEKVMALVKGKGTDMAEFTHGFTPALTPPVTLNAAQPDPLHTTTATTTSSKEDRADKSAARKRANQIPDGYTLSEDLLKWTRVAHPSVNIAHEFEQFRDYHRAKGSTMKDWDAAWRTWVRNSVKFARTESKPSDASLWDKPLELQVVPDEDVQPGGFGYVVAR